MTNTTQAVIEETTEEKQQSKKQVQSVELPQVNQADIAGPAGSIDILLDMNVPVTVTIGQTEIPVRRLLQLGPKSVLPLGKSVDEPVDLYINQTRFATADVVVVDGCFGVKIKTILGINKE
jgi:flagellar motor switch protein FliN/FliY